MNIYYRLLIQATILKIHNLHKDAIETVLVALVKEGVIAYMNQFNSAGVRFDTDMRGKMKEFWYNIGREVRQINNLNHEHNNEY